MNFTQFETFAMSEECFLNHDVSIIDEEGLQHQIAEENVWAHQAKLFKHISEQKYTIKIEQMERYWKFTDRTIHLFYNPKNGPTFDIHTDPVDVIIECKDGNKYMEVEGKEISLKPGDKLLIHAGTPHRALNYEKALMASHGINDTETLSRIRENN